MEITLTPIGFVATERKDVRDDYWGGTETRITLSETIGADALKGLEDFSHVEILFFMNQVEVGKIVTGSRHPRGNQAWPEAGIFAQRAKNRPNRIGATLCPVIRIEGNSLIVANLDAIDGTPVIDIKPVFREFLPSTEVRQPEWATQLMADYFSQASQA